MRIVLFSDIHANLPALEAFFDDIEGRNYDAIYCLGDLIGYNIWPNEVIQALRNRKIPTIVGNHDYKIGRLTKEAGNALALDHRVSIGKASEAYTNSIIDEDNRQYLRTLPAHIKVEFQLNQDKLNLLLVHGSPNKNSEYLFEDHDAQSMLHMMEESEADILCFGHTHKPYHRILDAGRGGQHYFRHAVNIGSIGKPKDGNPQGGYVILTINENSAVSDQESIIVEFIRFDYNIERAAKAVEESPLPDAFADMIRKGI